LRIRRQPRLASGRYSRPFLGGFDQVGGGNRAGRQAAAELLFLFLQAEDDGAPVLQGLQGGDTAQEITRRRGQARRGAAGGLGVGHPVEVFEVEPEDLGDRPGGLGQVDHAIEGQRGEQLAGEFLVVERGEAEGGPVGAHDLGLGQHGGEAAVEIAPGSCEKGQQADALGALELGGNGRHGKAARRVGVAQAHDVEQQLLFGGALDHLVVVQAGVVEALRPDAGAAAQAEAGSE
jgi:hypothetical protein